MSNAQTLVRLFELMDQKQSSAIRELLAPGFRMVMGLTRWRIRRSLGNGRLPRGSPIPEEARRHQQHAYASRESIRHQCGSCDQAFGARRLSLTHTLCQRVS